MPKLDQAALDAACATLPPQLRDKHLIAAAIRAYVDAVATQQPPDDDDNTDWMGIHHGRNT